jgi:hypothetical protein
MPAHRAARQIEVIALLETSPQRQLPMWGGKILATLLSLLNVAVILSLIIHAPAWTSARLLTILCLLIAQAMLALSLLARAKFVQDIHSGGYVEFKVANNTWLWLLGAIASTMLPISIMMTSHISLWMPW